MEQRVEVVCKKCSSKIPLSQMRSDKNQGVLVCVNCFEGKSEEFYQSADSKRVKYHCQACGFKFSRGENFSFNGLCFNCGKKSVQREDTKVVVMKDSKNLLDY